MRSMTELLVEMRRRRMFRVAGLYIVGTWVVLQVSDLAFSNWGFPEQAIRSVWIAALIGFPLALFAGWRFDIVDGRVVRSTAATVDGDLALTRSDFAIIAALAVLTVVTVYGLGSGLTRNEPPAVAASVERALDPRSIAVLPFKSVATTRDEADFLAYGIQDDLLTRLSKISALTVISRTSVERYRDSPVTTVAIGRELGVSKVVEGIIQRDGDQIRINVQLIDTSTDAHLWADTFDRDLTASNLFAVQTEVVEAIAQRLQATLTDRESRQMATIPTLDLDAYTAYLTGKQQADLESIESLTAAIASFERAIELDPEFALAYVSLANTYLTLNYFYEGYDIEESVVLAEPLIARAVSLVGETSESSAALGLLRFRQNDWPTAERAYDRALALEPNYSYVYRLYGRLRWSQGRRDEALEMALKAVALDPFYAPANFDVARYNDVLGNFDEALDRYLRIVAFKPDFAYAYVYIAAINYMVFGRADESLIWYHRAAQADALSASLHAVPAIAHLEIGDHEGARAWVEAGIERGPKTFWTLWTNVLLNLKTGQEAAVLEHARSLLERYPKQYGALKILRDADLAAGRVDTARLRYASAFRDFVESDEPQVNEYNYRVAVDLALVLSSTGEDARARILLERSLAVIENLPRHGTGGHWITDVQIFALQGDTTRALDALEDAVDDGWRVLAWYYLDHDPNLESIRRLPEFQRIRDRVRADMEQQAARVRDLMASGDLQPD